MPTDTQTHSRHASDGLALINRFLGWDEPGLAVMRDLIEEWVAEVKAYLDVPATVYVPYAIYLDKLVQATETALASRPNRKAWFIKVQADLMLAGLEGVQAGGMFGDAQALLYRFLKLEGTQPNETQAQYLLTHIKAWLAQVDSVLAMIPLKKEVAEAGKALQSYVDNPDRNLPVNVEKLLYWATEVGLDAKAINLHGYYEPVAVTGGMAPAQATQPRIPLSPVGATVPATSSPTPAGSGAGLAGPQHPEHQSTNAQQLTGKQVKELQFAVVPAQDRISPVIGEFCFPTSVLWIGGGGSGKTGGIIEHCNELVRLGYRVGYVSREQFRSPTFSKLSRLIPISDEIVVVKNIEDLGDLNQWDVIVIDSKDSAQLTVEDWIAMRDKHPRVTWHITSQATKGNDYRGDGRWRNEVDTLVYAEKRILKSDDRKNRWGGIAVVNLEDKPLVERAHFSQAS